MKPFDQQMQIVPVEAGLTDSDARLLVLRDVILQVLQWHRRGRLYGSLSKVPLSNDGTTSLLIPEPPDFIDLSLIGAGTNWILRFRQALVGQLPGDFGAARSVVAEVAAEFRIELIDCWAVGEFACKLFTGRSVEEYLRSPKAVASVQFSVRTLIDAALGCRPELAAGSLEQFLKLLESTVGTDEPQKITAIRNQQSGGSEGQEPADPLQDRIGHFRIVRLLGQGGMGDVYEGFDESLKRKVAIKVLPPELGRQESFVRRFYAEAASAAKLVHPHVVQIYFIGEDRGRHFFAMEFVSGGSLAEVLAKGPYTNLPEVLSIAEQVLQGLFAAHSNGLVHRDIKPGNILLEEGTHRCLLADFGLVKSVLEQDGPTQSGVVLGTMDYVSPEQGRGLPVDGRTDLYALGIVIYQMVSGRLPFCADSPTGMIFQHVYEPPGLLHTLVPGCSIELSAIVAKLMAKSPGERYQSAEEARRDVLALRDGKSLPSNAMQVLTEDPDRFLALQRSQKDRASASAMVLAPVPDDSDLPVSDRGPKNWLDALVSGWHDWIEQKSPAFAQRLQGTQLQIDRAITRLERHCEQLVILEQDARMVLKELLRELDECRSVHSDTSDSHVLLLVEELEGSVTDQQHQCEEITAQLNRSRAQLVQVRTERDVLSARLESALAKQRMLQGGKSRMSPRTLALSAIVIFLSTIALLILVKTFQAQTESEQKSLSDAVSPDAGPVAEPQSWSKQWPLEAGERVVIPLQSKARDLAIHTTDYLGQSSYSVYVCLSDDSIHRFSTRRGLASVFQSGERSGTANLQAMQVSRTATFLAIATGDGTISVHRSVDGGKEEYRSLDAPTLPGDSRSIGSMVFSGDESRIAAIGSDQRLRIWDIQSGKEVSQVETPAIAQSHIAASGSLNLVLIASQHRGALQSVVFWNAVTGVTESVFRLSEAANAIALSDDASMAYCHSAGTLFLWNPKTGEEVRRVATGDTVASIAPRAARAISGRGKTIKLWDMTSGKELQSISLNGTANISKLRISDTGEIACVLNENSELEIIHLSPVPDPPGFIRSFSARENVQALDVSSDARWVAGGGQKTLFLWNIHDLAASYTLECDQPVTTIRFSPFGNYLAYGAGEFSTELNKVAVRELTSDSVKRLRSRSQDWRKIPWGSRGIASIQWSADSTRVIFGSFDGKITDWTPSDDVSLTIGECDGPVRGMTLTKDRSVVWSIDADGTLIGRTLGNPGKEPSRTTIGPGSTHLALSSDDALIAVASTDGRIRVLETGTLNQIGLLDSSSDSVNCMSFIPDSDELVSGHMSGALKVWDVRRAQKKAELLRDYLPVSAVTLTPDGRYVVAASTTGKVNIWQTP